MICGLICDWYVFKTDVNWHQPVRIVTCLHVSSWLKALNHHFLTVPLVWQSVTLASLHRKKTEFDTVDEWNAGTVFSVKPSYSNPNHDFFIFYAILQYPWIVSIILDANLLSVQPLTYRVNMFWPWDSATTTAPQVKWTIINDWKLALHPCKHA